MPRVVFALCLAEVLGMVGFAAFPALLPGFMAEWGLSNTEAGWVSGVYYAGYMVGVPVLVALTDRVDPRRIWLVSTLLTALAGFGFAWWADGFGTALMFRALAGLGLAGTYMPGLKILSDRLDGPRASRWFAFYTASFGLAAGLSYWIAGSLAAWLDWRAAFLAAGAGALLALLPVTLLVRPAARAAPRIHATALLDFRPVLRTRAAMAWILGYAGHMWELFAMRSWIVAFVWYGQGLQPDGGAGLRATTIAAIVNLLGLPASILGNELAMRFGRRRVIMATMAVSALLAAGLGHALVLPFAAIVGLCFLYGVTVAGDSAALTAGAVAAAPEGYGGATLAVHSTLGFGAGFLGSLAVGIVLDLAGDDASPAWGLAFLTMGLGAATGAVALARLGRGR